MTLPYGYHDFTAGEDLTADSLEGYCEAQSVMIFASASARDTALSAIKREGMVAYLLDTNVLTVYSGTTWSTVGPVHGGGLSYTPTWSGTLGNGALTGTYWRMGKLITFRIVLIWGSTTSHGAGNQTFTAPVATDTGLGIQTHGVTADMASAATSYSGIGHSTSSTVFQVLRTDTRVPISASTPGTWTTNDWIQITGTYQAASDG